MPIIDPNDFRIELFNQMATAELGLGDQIVVYDATTGKPFRITLTQLDGVVGSGGGGGAVSSVYGRTGAVVAAQDDYTFAQLASKPTTLAGYGISDAAAVVHAHAASDITSGVFGHARLGTGGGGSTKFLREDGTYQTVSGGSGATEYTFNTQTGSYTAVLGDAGPMNMVRMNVASANNLTIPPNSAVAYPVGAIIQFTQAGAGATTLVAGSGVTLNYPAQTSLVLAGQGAQGAVIKTATDTWQVYANLTSTKPVSQAGTISAGTLAVDYSAGTFVDVTVNGNLSAITLTNLPATGTKWLLTLRLVANGTGYTQTWAVNGTTAKWDGGTAPTLPTTSGRVMIVQLSSANVSSYVDALLTAQSIQ